MTAVRDTASRPRVERHSVPLTRHGSGSTAVVRASWSRCGPGDEAVGTLLPADGAPTPVRVRVATPA